MNKNPKLNSSGCCDTIVADALYAVAKDAKNKIYRPLVFICSPFAGDVRQNTKNARKYSKFAVKKGAIPFAPHLLFPQFMDDTDNEQRELALAFGSVIMSKCDELWVFGKIISCGMSLEIETAKKRRMPIHYFDARGKEFY